LAVLEQGQLAGLAVTFDAHRLLGQHHAFTGALSAAQVVTAWFGGDRGFRIPASAVANRNSTHLRDMTTWCQRS